MACKNRSKVYLGYEDEFITDKHRSLVNFTTNKIGGKPDVHSKSGYLAPPICHLCGKHQLLAVQVYAPLENSIYHRTLYVFSCINPNCWNQHDSWTCLRVQSLEENSKITTTSSVSPSLTISPVTNWLSQADDWGDDTCDNMSEDNGNNNICDSNDSSQLNLYTKSCDIDDELNDDLSDLCLNDQNANSPASMESPVGSGGAVGRLESPQESAEIEGEESEVVCIDTPTQPQCNVMDLFNRVNPNPFQYHGQNDFVFNEIFMNVEEEELYNEVPQHVRDLFLEYQRGNPHGEIDSPQASKESKSIDTQPEKYEKSVPKHGDEMFYNFVDRIQMNPQQLLRYCRDNSAPLLPRLLPMSIGPCKYCNHDRIFELQILPTIIPKLKIGNNRDFELEFGTVLIFTCSKSCWSLDDTFKEELIIVQAEKFK